MNSGLEHATQEPSDWDAWLAAHTPGLLLFARQQTRSEEDAQDLVQEAVVECWNRQSGESPPPVALAYCTVRHRAIDLARSQKRRTERESAAEADAPPAWFDSSVEERERARLLQEAMKALPEIYRSVVTLKIWGGLTFAEIAEALDIPPNTAASRYRYGVDELRKLTREIFA